MAGNAIGAAYSADKANRVNAARGMEVGGSGAVATAANAARQFAGESETVQGSERGTGQSFGNAKTSGTGQTFGSAQEAGTGQTFGEENSANRFTNQSFSEEEVTSMFNEIQDITKGSTSMSEAMEKLKGTSYGAMFGEVMGMVPEGGSSGGCCFIFLEARYGDGTMDNVVRRFRDEHMTERNKRGYYKLAEILVPLMRKSKAVKFLVRVFMTDPMVCYGKYHYHQNRIGRLFKPLTNLWLKLFDFLGQEHKFIRENGEII
jgi:hypothetical protein